MRAYRKRESWVCECGMVLSAHNQRHYDSALHQSTARVKALLSTDCLTFTEIGNRLNLTRERVRQIAKKFGVIGRPRQKYCTVRRALETPAVPARNPALLHSLESRLDELKIPHQRILAQVRWMPRRYCTRKCLVNGFQVRVSYMCESCHDGGCYWRFNVGIKIPTDFYVLRMGDTGKWFILPYSELTSFKTEFAETPMQPGTKYVRHDYQKYIDAWHLLRKSKQEKEK